MYIKLSQKVEVEYHLQFSTTQNISFENQAFPILKICRPNITYYKNKVLESLKNTFPEL